MSEATKEFKIADEKRLNIKQFLFNKVIKFWYIYVLSILCIFPLAYYYNWYTTPLYNASSTLLISDEKNKFSQQDLLSQMSALDNTGGVDNEIELIRSRSMIAKTLRNLDFEVTYFLQGNFKRSELYKQSPISFDYDSLSYISYESPLEITIVDKEKYQFKFEGNDRIAAFEAVYRFGQQVQNPIGKFTINKTLKFRGDDYIIPDFEKRNFLIFVNKFDNVVDKYSRNLRIEFLSKKSTIVDLSLNDAVPQKAGDFLNMLMEVYIKSGVEHKNEIAANSLKFIDEQLQRITEDLRSSEEDLEIFKTEKGITDLGTEAQSFLGSVKVYDEKISTIDIQTSFLVYLEKYIKEDNEIDKISPASIGIEDPLLTKLIMQLVDLQSQRRTQLNSTKPDNPIIVSLDIQIQNTKQDLLENVRSIKDGLNASKEEAVIQLARIQGKIKSVPKTQRALVGIERQATIKEGLFNYLLQKRAETAILLASTISDNRIVNSARATIKPVKPIPAQTYAISLLLALILPAAFIYIRESLNDKIKDVSEISGLSEIPVLGMVGFSKETGNDIVAMNPESMLAESFRLLRTNIQFFSHNGKNTKVLITSSISSEGKSFCAANLSAIYAITGKKVVLVHGDLRKPKKNTEYKLPNETGISNYLIGSSEISEVIQHSSSVPNLDIILSGPKPPNPSELILNERMDLLFEYLNAHYDVIIVDSPPIGLVTDGILLSKYVDATIYVVRQNVTRKQSLDLINNIYVNKKIPNLSIILNAVKTGSGNGYGYGYGYGYGHGYGYYKEDSKKKST
jgi:tyrosine-protein kinase Etk/Wzc